MLNLVFIAYRRETDFLLFIYFLYRNFIISKAALLFNTQVKFIYKGAFMGLKWLAYLFYSLLILLNGGRDQLVEHVHQEAVRML